MQAWIWRKLTWSGYLTVIWFTLTFWNEFTAGMEFYLMKKQKKNLFWCPSIKSKDLCPKTLTHRSTRTTNCSLLKNKLCAMPSSRRPPFCLNKSSSKLIAAKTLMQNSKSSLRFSILSTRLFSIWLLMARNKSTLKKSKNYFSWCWTDQSHPLSSSLRSEF